MKKTLALALVAAMTISMASMTAFAKDISYSDETTGVWPEKSVATVSLTKKDLKENKDQIIGYKAKEAIDSQFAAGADVSLDEYAKLGENQSKCEAVKGTTYTIKFGDLGLKKFDNTATKTFFGWAEGSDTSDDGDFWKQGDDPAKKDAVVKDDKLYTYSETEADTGVTLTFSTVGRTDTDDETIAKNLKAIEDAKNGGDAAQKEKDRMAELDKQYNADGKNGYDKSTKEDKELQGKYTQKKKGDTGVGMDDFYTHAANVAGAPVDETKTWVYDVVLPDNTALYSGKTARTTIELDGVKDSADLSKFGVKVYHIEGWCKATKVKNVDVKGNKVTFWSDSFSPYVITLGDGTASTGADASNPSTGDFSAVPVALLAAAALGATGFVAYKKRKAE
ncbi:MAG: LPXTG cell wall anchor domain-containing protein [Clostridia bacterium]|nr:LPXTG cell wall anchor domain-containing protein [Clostridia bacterium]